MSTTTPSSSPQLRALQNRAIRTIHLELDFLRETGLLSSTDISNFHSLLPTLPPHSRASTPVAPVSPPRSPSLPPPISPSLLHRQTPLPTSATPAFPLNRATPMPSSATPANQKPSSGPPPPPGAGMGPVLVQALWDYPGPGNTAAQGDLTFKVGDTVEVVERTNADWWLGRMGGEVGLFPSGFVREVGQGGREGGAWAAGERPGAGGPGLGQARKPWGMRFAEMGV